MKPETMLDPSLSKSKRTRTGGYSYDVEIRCKINERLKPQYPIKSLIGVLN